MVGINVCLEKFDTEEKSSEVIVKSYTKTIKNIQIPPRKRNKPGKSTKQKRSKLEKYTRYVKVPCKKKLKIRKNSSYFDLSSVTNLKNEKSLENSLIQKQTYENRFIYVR